MNVVCYLDFKSFIFNSTAKQCLSTTLANVRSFFVKSRKIPSVTSVVNRIFKQDGQTCNSLVASYSIVWARYDDLAN